MLELLKDPIYIRYWLAVVVSFLGDAMTRITLIYLAAELTGSPAMIALVIFAQLLPTGLLGAFVGPLADRFPKRVLLVGADLARMVIVLAMIPFTGSIWVLVGLIVLSGIGSAFFETARIAAVPKIVGVDRLPAAVALFQSTYQTVYLLGPAIGGLLIGLGGARTVLVLDACTFVISAALLGSMAMLRERPAADAGHEPYWRSLRTGIRGVLAVPSLRLLLLILVPVGLVFGLFTTNLNAQLLTIFDLPAEQYGFSQAVFAGGSILGALLGPVLIARYRSPNGLLVLSIALFGAALLWLGPTQWLEDQLGLPAVLQWCVLTGLFAGLYQVPIGNTFLRDLPAALRGRGAGLLQAVNINCTLLGVAVGGLLAALIGVAGSIIVGGALLLVIVVAFIAPLVRRQSEVSCPQ